MTTPNKIEHLLLALKGAESALVKALPYLPADTVAVYCGKWLAEIRATIDIEELGQKLDALDNS